MKDLQLYFWVKETDIPPDKSILLTRCGDLVCAFMQANTFCEMLARLPKDKFWMQITMLVVIKRGEALNPRILVVYFGFEYRSVHEAERRGFTVKIYRQVRGRMLGHCSTTQCKGSDDGFDDTEEHEPAREDDSV